MQIDVMSADWLNGVEFRIKEYRGNEVFFARLAFEDTPGRPTDVIPRELRHEMTNAEAQRLLDGLYACGFRPSSDRGPDNATQRHLADLREIAMGALRKLGVEVK